MTVLNFAFEAIAATAALYLTIGFLLGLISLWHQCRRGTFTLVEPTTDTVPEFDLEFLNDLVDPDIAATALAEPTTEPEIDWSEVEPQIPAAAAAAALKMPDSLVLRVDVPAAVATEPDADDLDELLAIPATPHPVSIDGCKVHQLRTLGSLEGLKGARRWSKSQAVSAIARH